MPKHFQFKKIIDYTVSIESQTTWLIGIVTTKKNNWLQNRGFGSHPATTKGRKEIKYKAWDIDLMGWLDC